MRPARLLVAPVLATALLAALTASALAARPSALAARPSAVASARLAGDFDLAGRVTVADNVKGEHPGAVMHRIWQFLPHCPAGVCGRVTLVRGRMHGTDRLTLHHIGPGVYTGTGSFTAPLRCSGRLYRAGELVPFRITVTITTAIASAGAIIAGRINARYVGAARVNRTPCVAFLGHDAARYHGHLIPGV